MSFVEVFPTEPVIATTRASLRARTAPPIAASAAKSSSGTSVAAAPRARASSRIRLAAADGDEEVAGRDAARVDLDAGHLAPPSPSSRPSAAQLVERSGIRCALPASAAPRAPTRGRRTGSCGRRTPGPAPRPCRRSGRRRRRCASSIARAIAAARSGSTSTSPTAPATIASMIACGILAARVVGRDDHDVGELGGDASHLRALLAVAVAAAAEDADARVRRRELARGAQQRLERDRLVRVVDDHRERLPLVDRLESPRHAAHRLEPARDRVVVDPEQPRGGERAERVLDVEAAAQLQVDRRRAPPGRSPRRPRSRT